MIRKILQRASNIAHSISHFGHLGKVAATRSFLRRERRKLLVKLGEKALSWLEKHPEEAPELQRVATQIQKIDELLSREDYGGGEGVNFQGSPPERPSKRSASKKSQSR